MMCDNDMAAKKTEAEFPDVVRIPAELRARLQRVGAAMSERALTELPPSVVARAVLDRGLDALERELGLSKERKT